MSLAEFPSRTPRENLSLESKEELEAQLAEILRKDDFVYQDFNNFVSGMKKLSSPRDRNELAEGEIGGSDPSVRDDERKLNYVFLGPNNSGGYSIKIQTDYVKEDGILREKEGVTAEFVYYKKDERGRGFYPGKTTAFSIGIPQEFNNLTSLVDGNSISLFSDKKYTGFRSTEITDKEARDFCRRVHETRNVQLHQAL